MARHNSSYGYALGVLHVYEAFRSESALFYARAPHTTGNEPNQQLTTYVTVDAYKQTYTCLYEKRRIPKQDVSYYPAASALIYVLAFYGLLLNVPCSTTFKYHRLPRAPRKK